MRYSRKEQRQSHLTSQNTTSDNDVGSEDNSQKLARELFGLFLIFWGLLVLLSLISHDQRDPSLNHVVSNFSRAHNHAGIFGAYISGLLVDIFGFSAIVWPAIFIAWGTGCIATWLTIPWWRWLGFFLLASCLISFGAAWNIGIGDVRGGGIIGMTIYTQFSKIFGAVGSTLIWLFLFFISLEFAFGIAWLNLLQQFHTFVKEKTESYDLSLKNILTILSNSIPIALRPYLNIHKQKHIINIIPLYEIYDAAVLSEHQYCLPDLNPPFSISQRPTIASLSSYHSEQLQEVTPVISYQSTAEIHPSPLSDMDLPEHITITYRNITTPENNISKQQTVSTQQIPTPTIENISVDTTTVQKTPNTASIDALHIKNTTDTNQHPQIQTIDQSYSEATIPQNSPSPSPIVSKAKNVSKKKLPLPSLDLLSPSLEKDILPSPLTLKEKSKKVMDCLTDFNIQGELVRVTPGPVITLFEIRPAPGVRVSRIANLNDDIARSLMAEAVRIQAPVPGSDTVGIEIPNEKRSMVSFKTLIQSKAFQETPSILHMALGKDIEGKPTVKDLATMPHVLVAGTTGAGKSVCLNTILLSFLYNASPSDLKLMLIDPKRVELAMYTNLPHLVHPVVTEPALAKTALEWAVHEMDRRYNCLAQLGVKHFKDFNKKIIELGDNKPTEFDDLIYMPYLVIVIDELADLMMTAGKEVEGSIVRLAQLARAAGIHLIVATQRPSVDVVTGLIKANFPSRIAFQVANKYDSRTILDTTGAEQLLGKGDMLFKPNGGKIQRIHGAFVTDEEVQTVTEYWRRQQAPQYEVDFSEWGTQVEASHTTHTKSTTGSSNDEETLYAEAIAFVQEQGRMSISLLQRRFRIGFNKAARFVERMEKEGILPPASRGNKARTVRF